MKKTKIWTGLLLVYLVLSFLCVRCVHINQEYNNTIVRQFGKVTSTIDTPGVYFTNPLQDEITLYMGEYLYDITRTSVITKDKKTMISDAVITWRISDPIVFYKQLGTISAAEDRLSGNSFSSMKSEYAKLTLEEAISGKNGHLSEAISNAKSITSLEQLGITVNTFDIKALDLPDANRSAVFERMKSERKATSSTYSGEATKRYKTIVAEADRTAKKIRSDATAKAAEIIAEGDAQYYEILRNAYSDSPEKEAFYEYWIGLETLKESLKNGGTIQITADDPLYKILINSAE